MEVLELLHKMAPNERRSIIEQINATWPENVVLHPSEEQMLIERARDAKAKGFPGRPVGEVLADLRRANERDAQNR